MKEEKNHDHKLTKLLKFGIFATLMLAPFIAVGGEMAYTTFNKNANLSYTNGNYEEEKEYLNNPYTEDNVYYATPNNDTITTGFNLYVSQFHITNQGNIDASRVYNISLYTDYRLYFNTNKNIDIYRWDGTNGYQWYTNLNASTMSFEITFKIDTYVEATPPQWAMFYTYQETPHNTLDNAFYLAVDKVQQSDLFNWTTNTAIYNGINGMTTGLGIQTQAVPILLTYWIILTAVYVVFDIVIECFIWLTHIFNPRKLA